MALMDLFSCLFAVTGEDEGVKQYDIHHAVGPRAPARPSNKGFPPIPPSNSSIASSGCGIIPRMLPRLLYIPAIFRCEPFGLWYLVTVPSGPNSAPPLGLHHQAHRAWLHQQNSFRRDERRERTSPRHSHNQTEMECHYFPLSNAHPCK